MKRDNFNKNIESGFTLIELLVVVAIIGILASVVLASLNAARNKAADSAIKAAMANSRAQAALFYDTDQTYTNVCIAAGGINPMILNAAQKLAPTNTVANIITDVYTYSAVGDLGSSVCHDSDTAWAAITSLKNPTLPEGGPFTGGWCVDSTGASKESPSLAANATVCL